MLEEWTETVGKFLKTKDFEDVVLRKPGRVVIAIERQALRGMEKALRRSGKAFGVLDPPGNASWHGC